MIHFNKSFYKICKDHINFDRFSKLLNTEWQNNAKDIYLTEHSGGVHGSKIKKIIAKYFDKI